MSVPAPLPGDRLRTAFCAGLVALGLLQAIGWLVRSPALRGLGMATASSPLPIVFTEVRGVETFASRFALEYTAPDGGLVRLAITPKEYSRLGGPYNWRNVYGAAVSYGPVLPEPLWKSVLSHGLCDEGPLARILGAGRLGRATVIVESGTAGDGRAWRLPVECAP